MGSEPQWQELLRLRLVERNAKESAYAHIIEQYRRLAQQTKLLKERNASLLRAVGSVQANPSTSTVHVPGTSNDNPVQAAYISSLESQISSLRDELATVYKTQGQNAQRLLAMNETLREKEEAARLESEGLRLAHEELTTMREKIKLHSEFMHEKDRTAQILHDEINTLQLELGQIEDRNQTLTRDNAKLLQRWLDAKQSEANRMNEANDFYQEMRSQRQAVVEWRDGAPDPAATAGAQALHDALEEDATLTHGPAVPSRSGNGQSPAATATPPATDGTRSPNPASVSLTPNG